MTGRSLDQEYIARADKLLADGEWHDGLEWIIEIEKEITPGVAQRRQERIRAKSSSSPIRVKPLTYAAQIALGKRSITQQFVHARVAYGRYEVDPWPLPPGGWRQGGWKIRAVEPKMVVLGKLESEHQVHGPRLRNLILQDPPLRHKVVGRRLHVYRSELDELARRVEEYKASRGDRRRAAIRRTFLPPELVDTPGLTAGELSERARIADRTLRSLVAQHPELGWIEGAHGRVRLLPEDKLPEWDRIVEEYKAGYTRRRQEASRRSRAAERARPQSADDVAR